MSDLKIKKIDPSQIRYTPTEGEVIQTPEGDYLMWHEGNWNKFNFDSNGIEMGLYDMNKQIIAQLPDLDNLEEKTDLVDTFHEDWNNEYYMLYGREISYFTVFKVTDPSVFASIIFECVQNIGVVKAFDLTEAEDAIEIWVMYNDEPTCLYFFPYDMGLVRVGE